MGIGWCQVDSCQVAAFYGTRRHHVQRHSGMHRRNHAACLKHFAAGKSDTLGLAVSGYDLGGRSIEPDLAPQFHQAGRQGVRQRLHASHSAAQAEALDETQQREIDARALAGDGAGGTQQAAQGGLRHRVLEPFHDGGVGRAFHQAHEFRPEVPVLDQHLERLPFRSQVHLRGIDPHHGDRQVDEGVYQLHQGQELRGVCRAETADLSGGLLRAAAEYE